MLNKEHYYNTFNIMIDIYPPTGPEKEPYPEIKTSETEKKREKEKSSLSKEKTNGGSSLRWAVLQLVKKIIERVTQKNSSLSKKYDAARELLNDVMLFFEKLKKNDLAHDLESITSFTQNWILLQDEISLVPSNPIKNSYTSIKTSVEGYNHSLEHNLGYCLKEFTESEWLPTSLVKLLRELHLEHIAAPQNSQLTHWTAQVQELTFLMEKE